MAAFALTLTMAAPGASALVIEAGGAEVWVLETRSTTPGSTTDSGVRYQGVSVFAGEWSEAGDCSGTKRYWAAPAVTAVGVQYRSTGATFGCAPPTTQEAALMYCALGCAFLTVRESSPGTSFSPTAGTVSVGTTNSLFSFDYGADKSGSRVGGSDVVLPPTVGSTEARPLDGTVEFERAVVLFLVNAYARNGEAGMGACSGGVLNVVTFELITWGVTGTEVRSVCA